jgi:hypothetical protein
MKTDDISEEAEEPPEEPPCRGNGTEEENSELEWARRHVDLGWSGPNAVFRKTELHDRPPGTGRFKPATIVRNRRERIIEKLTARLDTIDSRLDEIEDRIDQVTGQLSRRIHAFETTEVS